MDDTTEDDLGRPASLMKRLGGILRSLTSLPACSTSKSSGSSILASKVKNLTNQVATFSKELQDLHSQIGFSLATDARLAELRDGISSKDAIIVAHEDKIANREVTLQERDESIKDMNVDIGRVRLEMQQKLSSARQESRAQMNTEIFNNAKVLEALKSGHTKTLDDLQETHRRDLDDLLETHQRDQDGLRMELECENAQRACRDQDTNHREQLEVKDGELEAQRKEIKANKQIIKVKSEALLASQNQFKVTSQELKAKNASMELQYDLKLQRLRTKSLHYQEQLHVKDQEINSLRSLSDTMEEECDDARRRQELLREARDHSLNAYKEFVAELRTLTKAKVALESELRELRVDKLTDRMYQKSMDAANRNCDEAQKKCRTMQSKLATIEDELKQRDSELQHLLETRDSLSKLKGQVELLSERLRVTEDARDSLKDSLVESRRESIDRIRQLKRLYDEDSTQREEEHSQELAELESRRMSEIEQIQADHSDIVGSLNAQIKEATEQLRTAHRSRLDKASFTTLPSRGNERRRDSLQSYDDVSDAGVLDSTGITIDESRAASVELLDERGNNRLGPNQGRGALYSNLNENPSGLTTKRAAQSSIDGAAKRSRTQGTLTSPVDRSSSSVPLSAVNQANQSIRRSVISDTDMEAKASELWSMISLDWASPDEEQQSIFHQLTRLFSKGRSIESVREAIDRHVVGNFRQPPAYPRPCLFGTLNNEGGGKGGLMTRKTCPYCSKRPDRVSVWAEHPVGVAEGFGERDPESGRVTDTTWRPEPKPSMISIDGDQVRWLLKKRRDGPGNSSTKP